MSTREILKSLSKIISAKTKNSCGKKGGAVLAYFRKQCAQTSKSRDFLYPTVPIVNVRN